MASEGRISFVDGTARHGGAPGHIMAIVLWGATTQVAAVRARFLSAGRTPRPATRHRVGGQGAREGGAGGSAHDHGAYRSSVDRGTGSHGDLAAG